MVYRFQRRKGRRRRYTYGSGWMGFPSRQWDWSGVVDMQSCFSRPGEFHRSPFALMYLCGKGLTGKSAVHFHT